MCDYSLEAFKSTKAQQGEDLRLTTFSNNPGFAPSVFGSKGFAPEGIVDCATCIPEGSIITIEVPEEHQYTFGVTNQESVKFIHVDNDKSYVYHDAVEFSPGRYAKLQTFPLGTKAHVLMLADEKAPEDVSLADAVIAYV